MKHKKLTLFSLFIGILLLSAKLAYAEVRLPQQHFEQKNVAINSGDYNNGYYEPWIINANDYPVKVSFDLYCLYGENGTQKYIGHYSKIIPANSGYIKFPVRQYNADCYWAFPKNVSIVPQ